VYDIGLPLVDHCDITDDIYIQQRPSIHENTRFLSISNLITALKNDPDLAYIPTGIKAQVMQVLYVVTGCDYISFFKGIGKMYFMQTFF
jgi:hypothetical protein